MKPASNQDSSTSDSGSKEITFDTTQAVSHSKTLRELKPLGKEDVVRMVEAWKRSGFME